MEDFQIVTVISHQPYENYYCLSEFFKSIRKYDYEPIVLGKNPGEFRGLGSKPKLLIEAIKSNTVRSKYMIFCDSFDLVFATSPKNVIENFKQWDISWVCSAEKNCFPNTFKEHFDPSPTSYRYLNSGFIVSTTEAMLAVLENMELEKVPEDYRRPDNSMCHINDQELFQAVYLEQKIRMGLDVQCILNQTLCAVKPEELDFTGKKIKNIETGQYPMSFHFNGPAKTDGLREPILKFLNL